MHRRRAGREDIGGDILAVLQLPVWARIRTAGLEHALLVAVEGSGVAVINELIRRPGTAPPRIDHRAV